MDIQQLFRPQDLIVGFAPSDKWQAIAQLMNHMVEQGRLPAQLVEQVLTQVQARERSMSTGMERGIAIPHAAVEEVETVQACMGICPADKGLEFSSIDGKPAQLIVLLLIPRAQKLLHIRTLADVARVLSLQSVREELIAAPTSQKAWEALNTSKIALRRE